MSRLPLEFQRKVYLAIAENKRNGVPAELIPGFVVKRFRGVTLEDVLQVERDGPQDAWETLPQVVSTASVGGYFIAFEESGLAWNGSGWGPQIDAVRFTSAVKYNECEAVCIEQRKLGVRCVPAYIDRPEQVKRTDKK